MPEFFDISEGPLGDLVASTLDIWEKGGWAMWAILVIAVAMFLVGMLIFVRLMFTGHWTLTERTWRRWIERPQERRGEIGRLLDHVVAPTREQTEHRFHQLRKNELRPFERDLKVMTICVSAAPLVGLLGTVTGMLATFGALSASSAGEKTMSKIAEGISEALITTMTGLVIALPGLFFQFFLTRGFEHYRLFLQKLEVVVSQTTYRRDRRAVELERLHLSDDDVRLLKNIG